MRLQSRRFHPEVESNPPGRGGTVRLALALLCVALVPVGTAVHAQALDDELVRLLDNNCTVLGNGQIPTDRTEFGANLVAICAIPETSNGASSGGGAASVQASSISIQNSAIQQRLARAKGEQRGEASKDVSWLLDDGTGAGPLSYEDLGGDAGVEGKRFNVFASGNYESLDRNVSRFEDGYDSTVKLASVGADYRFRDNVVGGVVATYRKHDGDFDVAGDFSMDSLEPAVYVSILPSPKTFVQVVAGYGSQSFDTRRGVSFTIDRAGGGGTTELSGLAKSSTDATVWSGSAQFGYDRATNKFTWGPRVGVNYSKTDLDAYTESGGTGLEMRVDTRPVKSFQGAVGVYGSAAYSKKSGVFLPQASVEYVQEFEDSASVLSAQFVEDLRGPDATTFHYQTNAPDSGFFNLNLGLAVGFPNGIWPYVNVRAMLGNSNFDNVAATVGVRFEL